MTKKRITLIVIIVIALLLIAIMFIVYSNRNYEYKPIINPSTHTIKNGRYYLNGDLNDCYFDILNNKLKLIGTKEQYKDIYDSLKLENRIEYDEWYLGVLDEWIDYKDFIIVKYSDDNIKIGYYYFYDENGYIHCPNNAVYIDENNIELYGGIFTLVESNTDTTVTVLYNHKLDT